MRTIQMNKEDDIEKHLLELKEKIKNTIKIATPQKDDVIYSSFIDVSEKHNVGLRTFTEYANDYRVISDYDDNH